jgi:CubicO group peptidase (beta-lactamase class C family)
LIFLNNKKLSQRLYVIFSYYIDKAVFPGAAVGISFWSGYKYSNFIYHYGLAQASPIPISLTRKTVFDLASLTKPMATVPALLSLMTEGKLSWDSNLDHIFPGKISEDKKNITIQQLMSHCSGLPAHKDYFKKLLKVKESERKKSLFTWIGEEKLVFPSGTDFVYSDLGFMLLGFIIEKVSAINLEEYIRKKIYSPLALHSSLFFAEKRREKEEVYAATSVCPWTAEMLSGRVHDDNCRAMGGVGGHAGLFGTIDGVVQWCEHLLSQIKGREKHPFYGNECLRKAVTREDNSPWTPGFDTPSAAGSSSGKFFSPSSFGHLGYTGTSFWIDPEKELIIVLLTNRVHQGINKELIKKFRPLFHDTVMGCLQNYKK